MQFRLLISIVDFLCLLWIRITYQFIFCDWKMRFSIKFTNFFLRITSFLTWVAYICANIAKFIKTIFTYLLEGGFNIYICTFKNDCNYHIQRIYLWCSIVYNFEILPTCNFFKNKYAFRNTQNIMFYFSIVWIYTIKIIKTDRSLNQILMKL